MTTRWTIGMDWDRDGSYTDETAPVLSAWLRDRYVSYGNLS